jgi:hypothetical protein
VRIGSLVTLLVLGSSVVRLYAIRPDDSDTAWPEQAVVGKDIPPEHYPDQVAWALRRFEKRQTEAKVKLTTSTMRNIAISIEFYHVDNHAYPVHCDLAATGSLRSQIPCTSFARYRVGGAADLTTPVAYIAKLYADPYAVKRGDTFGYYTTTTLQGIKGYVLFSPGPDGQFSFEPSLYDPALSDSRVPLIPCTFDPTNGTTSVGDIFWIKPKDSEKKTREWLKKSDSLSLFRGPDF